jgi:hypothetical protein
LEQSLRVIAQENHDLEKINNFNLPLNMNKKNSSPAAASAAINTISTNSDDENFYDIGLSFIFCDFYSRFIEFFNFQTNLFIIQ